GGACSASRSPNDGDRSQKQRERAPCEARSPNLGPEDRSAYWIAEPTEENFFEAFEPSRLTATMQTTAIRATRRAYSTRLAPRSVRPKRARMKGAQNRCQ